MGRHQLRASSSFAAAAGFVATVLSLPCVRAEEGVPDQLVVTRSEVALDCPERDELLRTVLALDMRRPVVASAPVWVQVEFGRDEAGYVATVRASGGKTGIRELRKPGDTCAALADATSVVVALLFDLVPSENVEPIENSPTPRGDSFSPKDNTRPPTEASERPERAADPKSVSSSGSSSIGFGLQAGVGYGLVGATSSPALGAAVRPRFDRFEAFAGVLWVPTSDLPYATQQVEVTLLTSRFGGCLWFGALESSLGLAGCLAGLVGAVSGRGRGFATDLSATDLWLAAEAAANGRLELSRHWSLRFGIALLVARPHTFSVEDAGVVVEPPPVAVLAELGPEFRFP